MHHVNFLSGGIGSWAAGMRIAEKHGTSNLINLFTDTKKLNDQHPHRGEDQDLYRFLIEGWKLIGGQIEWISASKNVWQVFEDVRYMGNSRIAPCSHILKQREARKWIENRFKPNEVTLYIGLDWTEIHRVEKTIMHWMPYKVKFPLVDEPYLSKEDLYNWVERLGVERPRLYKMGFAHNNCGGFCVKAGLGHFYNLLKTMPDRYKYHEDKQEELFAVLGKRVPFLRQTIGGNTKYLSLKEYRLQIEEADQYKEFYSDDIGGCGCFNEFNDDNVVFS
jgi:hypothetical protein